MPSPKPFTLGFVIVLSVAGAQSALAQRPANPQGPRVLDGYSPDIACHGCHADVAKSYQDVGMARSFLEATAANAFEDFSRATGYHKPSRRHFSVRLEDGRYIFKRHQLDEEGAEINVFERQIDWLLGSGANSRSYIFQTESGEMFQIPIVYYSQEKIWYMAPGYDRADHQGVTREVRRECMFCHNSYPDVATGSDVYGAPHVYPEQLPLGIGCQRCHGPGQAHIVAASQVTPDLDRVRETIVNPSRLEPAQRDAVCDQCHLQPSVTLLGVRKFGRSDYSFRPGEPLSDYLAVMDVAEESEGVEERFEINHHSYRLRQSQCFQQSEGRLSCTTCHDPHRKAAPEDRAAHYREACLGCHDQGGLANAHSNAPVEAATADCATCHMPQRRTQDVVHVVATDHLITRTPGGPELTAPRGEIEHHLTEVRFLDPRSAPPAPLADIYRAATVARFTSGTHKPAVDSLAGLLAGADLDALDPLLDLTRGQLRQRQIEAARQTADTILEHDPENLRAQQWKGLTSIMAQQMDDAEEQLLQALRVDQNNPESHYNLGLALFGKDEDERARKHLGEAVRLRENMHLGWYYLGRANANVGRMDEAVAAFKRALAIEPSHTRSYLELGKALLAQNYESEARRYYRHGLSVASQLSPIAKALDELEAGQQ